MAKPPSKRRGITLAPNADRAASLALLQAPPAVNIPPPSDRPRPASETDGTPVQAMADQLAQLRRLQANLDSRWQLQAEQLREQLQQLKQQWDPVATHKRGRKPRGETGQTLGRISLLLALLAIAGVAALGLHTWPRLQDMTANLNQVSAGMDQLARQLDTAHQTLGSLTADLGALRASVDNLPTGKVKSRADAGPIGSPAGAASQEAMALRGPYWPTRPMMPW